MNIAAAVNVKRLVPAVAALPTQSPQGCEWDDIVKIVALTCRTRRVDPGQEWFGYAGMLWEGSDNPTDR